MLCFETPGEAHHDSIATGYISTVTFLFFFYSTTIAMSMIYALDSAVLRFE